MTKTLTPESEVTTEDMAAVLGIHPRTLQQLAKEGWVDGKVGHNRWKFGRTMRTYLSHVQLEAIAKRR